MWPNLNGLQYLELDDLPGQRGANLGTAYDVDFGLLLLALDKCHALKHLQTLSLSSQGLDAWLPANWGAFTQLKVLRLNFNKLHGRRLANRVGNIEKARGIAAE